MKKIILAAAIVAGLSIHAKAEDIFVDFGKLSLHVPVLSGVDAAFGYDFKGHQSQGLAETAFAKWNIVSDSVLVFKAGGITTEKGKGAPFLGLDYELKAVKNPVPSLADIHPGIYGGRDFHANEWFYGIKASVDLF